MQFCCKHAQHALSILTVPQPFTTTLENMYIHIYWSVAIINKTVQWRVTCEASAWEFYPFSVSPLVALVRIVALCSESWWRFNLSYMIQGALTTNGNSSRSGWTIIWVSRTLFLFFVPLRCLLPWKNPFSLQKTPHSNPQHLHLHYLVDLMLELKQSGLELNVWRAPQR